MKNTAERIKRISKTDVRRIQEAAAAVDAGKTRNHIEVAIETGWHPVDAASILGQYTKQYNATTVAWAIARW